MKLLGIKLRHYRETLSASLADEDAAVQNQRWQWLRKAPGGTWSNIAGATADGYSPAVADTGHVLQAKVSYTDAHGAQQTASAATAAVDARERLLQVALTGWGRSTAEAAVDVIGRRITPSALAGAEMAAVTVNRRALQLPAGGDTTTRGQLLRGFTEAFGVRVSGDRVTFTPPSCCPAARSACSAPAPGGCGVPATRAASKGW